ncbi:MAG: hypothetical protein CMI09_10530 [Oceanospirillaceae bacterium]|nr:hypothetical protein [Oceanospirillaceae bacterium]|tara:strand:+ start:799 stop:1341 length:543 start_codon:yes stop_codon:yes gene_type:complete
MQDYQDVLTFWFEELKPAQWWKKDVEMDATILERFGDLHRRGTLSELFSWRQTAHGRLAEVIVLDQFSRNMYRDDARAFASDGMALALAQEAVACGDHQALTDVERSFLYMPYMHSESAAVHDVAVALFRDNGIESNYDFELKHKVIIDRFGRYPHRNAILGRESTPEELEFLKQPGSRF